MKNVIKLMVYGTGISLPLSCHSFIKILIIALKPSLFQHLKTELDNEKQRSDIFFGLDIFNIFKMILLIVFKISYSVAIVRMARMTKSGLERSSK